MYGVRDLLNRSESARTFAASQVVQDIVEKFFDRPFRVVRAIYFDKTDNVNWKVPWHQDLTITVKERRETANFGPWTQKASIWHVQPNIEILEKMITLRFHLDDADESNGALKVIPGSHKHGRLSSVQIKELRAANEQVICRAGQGDCLVMRPLLLHSSSAGSEPSRRRVVHLEISDADLPNGLAWHGS